MPTAATPILTLAETKPYLRIDRDTNDALLTSFIASASQMIVNRVGQIGGSPTLDEWYDGGSERIVLRSTPVQSITSVTESYGSMSYTLTPVTLDSGSTTNAYTYTVDLDAGVLVRRASGVAQPFANGVLNVHVIYVGGYGTVPADIKQACGLLVKHFWETQRGSAAGTGTGGTDMGPGLSWPRRVEEILAPYDLPGIA